MREFGERFGLTDAELGVLVQLMEGHSAEEICIKLGITLNTVKTHLKSLFQKTNTRRQGEIIAKAYKYIIQRDGIET